MLDVIDAINVILQAKPKRENDHEARYSCPFAGNTHAEGEDKSGDFVVFKESKSYYCFACSEKGSLVDLKAKFAPGMLDEDLNKLLVSKYVSLFNHTEIYETFLNKEVYLNVFSDINSSKQARSYINKRRISLETANKLGLQYSDYHNAITFPIYDFYSNLYGFQARFINPGDIKIMGFLAKTTKHFLGAQLYDKKKPILIVEGLFGYAHLHEIGADKYFNILANMGSKLSPEKIAILQELDNSVYILSDNDIAGRNFIYKKESTTINDNIYELAKHINIYIPKWPYRKKDPDELNLDEIKYMRYNTNKIESVKQYSLFS